MCIGKGARGACERMKYVYVYVYVCDCVNLCVGVRGRVAVWVGLVCMFEHIVVCFMLVFCISACCVCGFCVCAWVCIRVCVYVCKC